MSQLTNDSAVRSHDDPQGKLRSHDARKLWTGNILGGVILVTCLVISGRSGATTSFHILLCLLGGTAVWTVGIVAAPFNEEEKTKFSEIWKGFLALGSGYAIAKLEDPIVQATINAIRADTLGVAIEQKSSSRKRDCERISTTLRMAPRRTHRIWAAPYAAAP